MQLTRENLDGIRERLLELFPLEPVPKLKLADALVRDCWGMRPPGLPGETWANWLEIPDELLNKYEILLTYFMGSDLVYFLPRFVIQLVKEGGVSGDDFSNATSSFILHLSRWHARGFKNVPLNPAQMEFLIWVLNEASLNGDLKGDMMG